MYIEVCVHRSVCVYIDKHGFILKEVVAVTCVWVFATVLLGKHEADII